MWQATNPVKTTYLCVHVVSEWVDCCMSQWKTCCCGVMSRHPVSCSAAVWWCSCHLQCSLSSVSSRTSLSPSSPWQPPTASTLTSWQLLRKLKLPTLSGRLPASCLTLTAAASVCWYRRWTDICSAIQIRQDTFDSRPGRIFYLTLDEICCILLCFSC